MKGLDTNVLARYFAQDDPRQSPKATAFIQTLTSDDPGFIATPTLVELVWVMQSCYKASRSDIAEVLRKLLSTQEFVVENAEVAIQALGRFAKSKADFTDCLIERSGNMAGCAYTATFDKEAARFAGMRLID